MFNHFEDTSNYSGFRVIWRFTGDCYQFPCNPVVRIKKITPCDKDTESFMTK